MFTPAAKVVSRRWAYNQYKGSPYLTLPVAEAEAEVLVVRVTVTVVIVLVLADYSN
jgi:hypothetical protein